jgi:hypothetical protein
MNFLQVPTDVLSYAGKLSATQMLIWADAWTFKKNTGKAYRTNAQLSEMLNVTERSVSRAVQELIRMNAITVQSNGRNRLIDANHPSEWKVDTNVHRRTRPSTQTSTDVDVHADSTDVSMQGRHERPCRPDADVHLIEKRIEKEIEQPIEKEVKPKKEAKPKSLEDVIEAFEAVGSTEDEAMAFFDYWESAGWRRKGGPIKDWKATARGWLRNQKKYGEQNSWRDRSSKQLDAAKALEWANSKR